MILDSFRTDGRVALVTGASRGLGRALALSLAQTGADVALLDRSGGGDVAQEVQASGRQALAVPCDLLHAGRKGIEDAVARVESELGPVDILVNNAGIIRRAPAIDHAPEDWDDVTRVNLDAVFHLSQIAGRGMVARGWGRIVNIASMLSFQGGITVPGYTASKHAVAGLTKALANEWASSGVTVNAIAPGYMSTDNTAPLRADEARANAILERIPAGRWGTPEDLQGLGALLASDAGAYINGAVIPVDGGWLAR